MDRTEVQELIRQLKSADEALRLRAVNVLAGELGEEIRLALPTLKDAFLNDPNPAVKYLARKALKNHGIDPDDLARGGAAAGPASTDSGGTGVLALQGGVRAFFRTAQEYLRAPFNTLCSVLQYNAEIVGPWVLEKAEALSVDLLLPHLVELHAAEQGAVEGAGARLVEIAKRWHEQPREATFPERADVREAGLAEALAVLASSPTPVVRALALALGYGQKATLEQLLKLLDDESPLVQGAAATALAELGARRREMQIKILTTAASRFKPGEPESKLIALARLMRALANSTTLAFLKVQLPATSGAVRAALIDVAARLKIADAEKADLCGAYLKDPSPLVVTRAMSCLWHSSQKPFITYTLSRYINHADAEVRRELADALKDTGQEDALPFLFQLLKDPQDKVRLAAVHGLDKIAGPSVLDRLVELLADPNAGVRALALRAIVEVAHPDEAALLRQGTSVTEAPQVVKVECPNGLRGGGKPISTEIELKDTAMRESALAALEGLADPKFSRLVEALVLDRDPRVKARAARLLWKYGELWACDSVNELLSSGEPNEWEAGVHGLAELVEAVRVEGRLMHFPLLRTALRKHPQFESHSKKK